MIVVNPKDGTTYNLTDQTQIDAFIASGWIDQDSPGMQHSESEPDPAPRTRRTRITEE